jgi:hypothetical protein
MWRLGRSAHQWALPEMGSKHCKSEKHEATSSPPAKFAKNTYASNILRRCGHFKRAAQFDNTCSPRLLQQRIYMLKPGTYGVNFVTEKAQQT